MASNEVRTIRRRNVNWTNEAFIELLLFICECLWGFSKTFDDYFRFYTFRNRRFYSWIPLMIGSVLKFKKFFNFYANECILLFTLLVHSPNSYSDLINIFAVANVSSSLLQYNMKYHPSARTKYSINDRKWCIIMWHNHFKHLPLHVFAHITVY